MNCPRRAFTLVELIAAIAIVAILVAVMIPAVGNFVSQSRQTADRQTLAVLNDAINRYKMQGGDVSALTSGKHYSHLLDTLRTPVSWNGITHQFLLSSDPALDAATSLQASGNAAAYKLTSFGSYTEEAGGTPVNTGTYYIVKEDAEGTGTPSGWSDTSYYACTTDWDYTGDVLAGTQSLLFQQDNAGSSNPAGSYLSAAFPANGQEWWMFLKIKVVTLPVNSANIITIRRAGDNAWQHLWGLGAASIMALNRGNTAGGTTVDVSSYLGGAFYLWYHRLADGSGEGWISSTPSRSVSPQWTISAYNSGQTGSILFGIGSNGDLILDSIRIAETEIGNNPE